MVKNKMKFRNANKLLREWDARISYFEKSTPQLTYTCHDVDDCIRSLWYGHMSYDQKPMDMETRYRLNMNKEFETFEINRLNDAGVLVRGNQKLTSAIGLSGYTDLLVQDGLEIVPVEMKALTERSWYVCSDTPYPGYLAQLQSYICMGDFSHGYLYLTNRNNGKRTLIHVERNDKVWEEILEKVGVLRDYKEGGTVPPKPSDADCRWCGYKVQCRKDGD